LIDEAVGTFCEPWLITNHQSIHKNGIITNACNKSISRLIMTLSPAGQKRNEQITTGDISIIKRCNHGLCLINYA